VDTRDAVGKPAARRRVDLAGNTDTVSLDEPAVVVAIVSVAAGGILPMLADNDAPSVQQANAVSGLVTIVRWTSANLPVEA
jgi:hypothetical protein